MGVGGGLTTLERIGDWIEIVGRMGLRMIWEKEGQRK
jgi:hypothetical protein